MLVDFWAYSCINCQRAIAHVNAWYDTYKADGFVVIGVHTPEYAFEHVPANIAAGAKRLGIQYPVAFDNDYKTWDNYANQSWPADYLIDATGTVRFTSAGEGRYPETEQLIRSLLGKADQGRRLPAAPPVPARTPPTSPAPRLGCSRTRATSRSPSTGSTSSTTGCWSGWPEGPRRAGVARPPGGGRRPPATQVPDRTPTTRQSPETYLGGKRAAYYGGADPLTAGAHTYRYPADIQPGYYALDGTWTVGDEAITAGPNASIGLYFLAGDVYLDVSGTGTLTVRVDQETTTYQVRGAPNIYPILHRDTARTGLLQVTLSPGLSAYSFTFG